MMSISSPTASRIAATHASAALIGFTSPSIGIVGGTAIDLNAVNPSPTACRARSANCFGVVDRRLVKALQVAAAEMAVQSDRIPHRSTPQLVTRNPVNLADDIPQARDRFRQSPSIESLRCRARNVAAISFARDVRHALGSSPTNSDAKSSIAPTTPQVCHSRVASPPSVQARLVGHNFHEYPVAHAGMTDVRFHRSDSHQASLDFSPWFCLRPRHCTCWNVVASILRPLQIRATLTLATIYLFLLPTTTILAA